MKNSLKKHNLIDFSLNLIILLLASYILSQAFFRIDLTSEKRYTLTETTLNTLKSLDDNVVVRIYLENDQLPPGFKRLRTAVQEILDEYSAFAKVGINYEFINPSEGKNEEMKYRLYEQLHRKGILPIELKERTSEGKSSQIVLFPGASIIYKGRETIVNFLKNNRTASAESNLNNSEQALEYEFTNALLKLSKPIKQKIAFAKGHGELPEQYIKDAEMNLKEHYDVEHVDIVRDMTDLNEYSLLIFAKPTQEFSESEKYVVDQYLMNGGKLLWFIDGVVTNMDSLMANNETLAMANSINLTDQLFRYGVRINHVLVEDLQCAPVGLSIPGAGGKPQIKLLPWQFFPLVVNHADHSMTKYLGPIKTNFISSTDTVGASSLIKKQFLLYSSQYTKTTPVPARINFDLINNLDETLYNHKPIPVAVLLEGNFPSVFNNRVVGKFTNSPNDFKSESLNTKMIVVADGDVIKNEVSPNGEVYPLGFDRHSQQTFNGNLEFVKNAVNYLCDDAGLMKVRDRELKMRLLDKEKLSENRTMIQTTNVVLPVVVVLIFGMAFMFYRKNKYGKK